MRETHLRNVDLNLLRAIQPLLEERHISRAAKRAFLSQPAMSPAILAIAQTHLVLTVPRTLLSTN